MEKAMVIYKWNVVLGENIIQFPDAECVFFGFQDGSLMMWAVVDPDLADCGETAFIVVGTGHLYPQSWEHQGSVIAGSFVWHLMKGGE